MAANRIYAERIAKERAIYKRQQEIKQEKQTSFEIPGALVSEVKDITGNDTLKKINKAEPALRTAWNEKNRLETDVKKVKDKTEEAVNNPKTADTMRRAAVVHYQKVLNEYNEVTAPIEQAVQDIKAELAEPYQKLFREHKTKHGGFLIGEDHKNPDIRYWIAENVANMKAAGIHTIYMEHFFNGTDQKLITEFLEEADKTKPMNLALEKLCGNFPGTRDILLAARENDMKVIGLASTYAQADTAIDPYTRVHLFNQHAEDQIAEHQNSLEESQRGFVVLAGHGHLAMHEGRDKSRPIQGLAQRFGMHVFEINSDKQVTVSDPELIYVPKFNEETKTYSPKPEKIQDYCQQNNLTVARVSYEEMYQEDLFETIRPVKKPVKKLSYKDVKQGYSQETNLDAEKTSDKKNDRDDLHKNNQTDEKALDKELHKQQDQNQQKSSEPGDKPNNRQENAAQEKLKLEEDGFVEITKEEIKETNDRFRKQAFTFEEISKEDIKKPNKKPLPVTKEEANMTQRSSKVFTPRGKK